MTGVEQLDQRVDALVGRVAQVHWTALDEPTRDATGRAIFDCLGVASAGSSAPGIAPSLAGLAEIAGRGSIPVPWSNLHLGPADAAFALSLLIHAWDFDDTHDEAVVHACTVAVPAALATAHATDASGRRMLEGVVAGVEMVIRLALAIGPQPGMVRTASLAAFGAAAASGRVLGLDPARLAAALALAAPMTAAPTTRQVIEDGAIAKRHQPGFGVRHGVLAAFLARAGVDGAVGWFSGTYGLGRLVGDHVGAAAALGRPGWEVGRLSLKPYPACRYVHAAVAGALELRAGSASLEVDQVEVHVPAGMAHELVARPWRRRGQPIVDAQFSIPWSVAAALVRGDLGLPALGDEALHDHATEALARRVTVLQDRAADGSGMTPVDVVLHERGGGVRQVHVGAVPGSPEAPLGWDAIAGKVRGCLRVGDRPLEFADQLATQVRALPSGDVRTGLAATTAPSGPARSDVNDKEPSPWISA